jgi:hypothetical protein
LTIFASALGESEGAATRWGRRGRREPGRRERDAVVGFLLSVRVLTDTPKQKFLIAVLASSHGDDGV